MTVAAPPHRPEGRRRLAGTARVRTALAGAAGVAALGLVAGCATVGPAGAASGDAAGGGGVVRVVAAENFWGSIAAQLGGAHARVTSIISNPDTDPHAYEPTTADARTLTTAQLAIVNGVGYDGWADKLLATNADSGRTELNVGDLVGVRPGGNPHRWYSPDDVRQVIARITADYKRIDPADASYFDQRRSVFETQTLAPYNQAVAGIRAAYAGTPIGASESIVTPLAEGLGLKLITPETFLDAMSEGSDPTAADKTLIDRQIREKQIKIYVYNTQNSTPDVIAQVDLARQEGIPVATVTETLSPARDTFEQWQVTELQGIAAALKAAGAR
ncbi:zinc ABC transporter solute-binding protein [Streptacidiphilus sp. PB12-B1b]|uniref:metal ABC transporter solute-binding protein, Zn/Mn family n=1 Tax=Streptacidiphilus sp. PB12-B1b TaxID=2705012 RepID=UPI0015FA993D|nr:zinc ABC transporter substrate-binding protein [Streptacidiphilus sp. PB12-B1b]QMU79750.1 zinc ABC transporter solute-binding protein [Streptacidiphilus sp. PB12-B1b]